MDLLDPTYPQSIARVLKGHADWLASIPRPRLWLHRLGFCCACRNLRRLIPTWRPGE